MNNNNNNNKTWEEFYHDIYDKIPKNSRSEYIKLYILNEKNTYVTKEYIDHLLSNLNYKCNDLTLFQLALIHPSYTIKNYELMKEFKSIFMGVNVLGCDHFEKLNEANIGMAIPLQEHSYERLEFLGDSILRQILSDYIFIRFPEFQEGGLTKLRAQLENATTLSLLTKKIKLNRYVMIARNHEMIKGRERSEKIQCDIFEAFLAALYLDATNIKYADIGKTKDLMHQRREKGYQICFDFVISLIETEIDIASLLASDTNYKDQLLQYFHTQNWGDPKYSEMERIIDEKMMGKKSFKMCVRDPENNIVGIGIGSSKQSGEKLAAKRALIKFNVLTSHE